MFGRIMNDIQSYDYIDNEKYKRIEKLLEIMKETFGFEADTPEGEEGDQSKKMSGDIYSRQDSAETGKEGRGQIELN
jgi:hypothetical protein